MEADSPSKKQPFETFKMDQFWGSLSNVGNNNDNSKIGRTYLKFGLGSTQNPKVYPHGGLFLYAVRQAKTGSVSVAALRSTITNWQPASLVWTNAPAAITGGTTSPSLSISWDKNAPTMSWQKINVLQHIEDALAAGASPTTTLLLQSTNESNGGWAYFASSTSQIGGQSGYGARLLYATGYIGPPGGTTTGSTTGYPGGGTGYPGGGTAESASLASVKVPDLAPLGALLPVALLLVAGGLFHNRLPQTEKEA